MPFTESTTKINEKLLQASKSATNNPYVARLLSDESLRDDAINAFKSARNAFDRASAKNWNRDDLAKDKKLRRELQDAITGLRSTRESLSTKPKRRRGRLRKLFALVLIGAGAAIAVNGGVRKAVLDTLFGKEEEFKYTSTTTGSTNGAP